MSFDQSLTSIPYKLVWWYCGIRRKGMRTLSSRSYYRPSILTLENNWNTCPIPTDLLSNERSIVERFPLPGELKVKIRKIPSIRHVMFIKVRRHHNRFPSRQEVIYTTFCVQQEVKPLQHLNESALVTRSIVGHKQMSASVLHFSGLTQLIL